MGEDAAAVEVDRATLVTPACRRAALMHTRGAGSTMKNTSNEREKTDDEASDRDA
jgi:hypothetical protein